MKIRWLAPLIWSAISGLASPPASAADAPRKAGSIPATAIQSMEINVSNADRSLKWYQGLFGAPVEARDENRIILRIGNGPRYLAITEDPHSAPGITRIGLGVKDFAADHALAVLREHAVAPSAKTEPMTATKPKRNAPADIGAGVRFDDPAGIIVELQNLSLKEPAKPLPSIASRGLLELHDYNHFTIFVPDAKRNVQFYQRLFGLRIDTYQGPMPIIRVGDGTQFFAFVGGRIKAFVHHACFAVVDFAPDRITRLLRKHGLRPRSSKRQSAGPLEYYVTMRMPNRGGAPQGTPELYLTDPDGILLQIQDVRYNGGGGYLGDQRGGSKTSN